MTSPTSAADPPRQPTKDDRKRIRDALDEHYVEDRGCYAGAMTDKALGAQLDVPFAWIGELREAMGLGPDKNEVAAVIAGQLNTLRQGLAKSQAEIERLIERLSEQQNQLDRLEKQLGRA